MWNACSLKSQPNRGSPGQGSLFERLGEKLCRKVHEGTRRGKCAWCLANETSRRVSSLQKFLTDAREVCIQVISNIWCQKPSSYAITIDGNAPRFPSTMRNPRF